MKEKLTIRKSANLVDEAILILYQWANKDAMEQMREEYRGYYQGDPDGYNYIWNTILDIYDTVKEGLKPKKNRIDYYFKSQNINFFFHASFAFLWDFHNTDNKLLPYEERVRGMTEEDRIRIYAQVVNIDEEDDSSIEGVNTYEDFLRFLDTSACNKEVKWDILQIFHNQKEYYNEVTAILKEVIDILETKFRSQIADIEKQFYDYWAEIQESKDIIELVQQNLKITWKESELGTVLLPIIFQPTSVTFSTNTNTQSIDILRIGIMLDHRLNISRKKMGSEDIVNFGKLLSDKSKVDILEMTSIKPCYGKEIATELGLSTATISYHVNALMRLGLLKTELSSNRVYYSMNSEKLAEYLEDIRDHFTT